MSGQPLINATDASKFRQNYLANLALRANNDDMNLQANKIYKKIGQTPTQITDSRTTNEKLADIERLKIDVRSSLTSIADGEQATAIAQGLDPTELLFVAQHIDEITKIIKPKYKYGITAEIFIPFLTSYMNEAQRTNEVNMGLQQTSGRHLIMSIEQILNETISLATINLLRNDFTNISQYFGNQLKSAIIRDLNDLQQIIPTQRDLVKMRQIEDANIKSIIQEELSSALRVLPTNNQVFNLLRALDTANKLNDRERSGRIGLQLHQILSVEPTTKEQMLNIKQRIGENNEIEELTNRLSEQIEAPIEVDNKLEIQKFYRPMSSFSFKGNDEKALKDYNEYVNNGLKYINSSKGAFTKKTLDPNNPQSKKKNAQSVSDRKRVLEALNGELRMLGWGERNPEGIGKGITQDTQVKQIKGNGIARNVIVKKTDYSQGILPSNSKYIPFGRYHLDNHKLQNNILAIKRGTGCNVAGFPIERISKELCGVLHTIVGGGQPQFNQLDSLTPDEKIYLHKLAKKVDILDRLSIPTPNKDENEKDTNQFEIMKGEILNGNDSIDLIKKFKLLIIKMVKKELLPKSQANDILMELATLGY
jgi:hypothetical protein